MIHPQHSDPKQALEQWRKDDAEMRRIRERVEQAECEGRTLIRPFGEVL